jgi:sigma-E factor negative regulatory protein RseA
MNEALRLQVSAYVDGELPDNEAELLMRRLSQDPALRELVAGYLGIGRLIRREREVPGIEALRGRIQAALGEQPVEAAVPTAAPARRFLRPIAGLAVASTVAAVALLGLGRVDVPEGQPGETIAPASVAATPGYTEPQPSEVLSNRPSELLMQYYLSHDATSRDLGANGILTRFVTLELREGERVQTDAAGSIAVPAEEPGAREAPTDATSDPARPNE